MSKKTLEKDFQLKCQLAGLPGENAPCLLLVHGFGEDRHIWADLTERLKGDFKIIAPDLPGFGKTPPLDHWSMEDAADLLADLLQRNGIKNCLYIGHSMGGYVGAAFAERYASALSGILFFHSTAYADPPEKRQQRKDVIRFLENNGSKTFIDNFLQKLLIDEFRQQHSETLNVLKKRALTYPLEAWTTATRAMMQRPDRTAVLTKLTCPVGYLMGKRDAFINYRQSLAECHLARIGFMRIFSEAGHAAMFEAPNKAEAAVREFANYCFER